MTLSVDLFFSFRSPYSYLALPRTMRLVADYDATVNLRPVYPLAVRVPGFFKRANPQFARYVVLDSSRVAQHENIPFRFPRPTRSCRTWRRWMSPSTSPTSTA
jgi:2-hydroxychromene-2-carboxylate isomerase